MQLPGRCHMLACSQEVLFAACTDKFVVEYYMQHLFPLAGYQGSSLLG